MDDTPTDGEHAEVDPLGQSHRQIVLHPEDPNIRSEDEPSSILDEAK